MDRRDILKVAPAALIGVVSLSAAVEQQPQDQQGRRPPPNDRLRESVKSYLAAWNERDPKRRLELVAQTWVDDGSYVDHARQANDHESISAMIGKAQIPYPGYRTALASTIECHHQYVRFSWFAGGSPDTPLYIKGTDIVVLAEDARFKAVIGFVDVAPTSIAPG
jgi:hypothetical protein